MTPQDFSNLFKDILPHLYDYAVLETHPLVGMVEPVGEYHGTRGEYLRDLIYAEIERFKPEGRAGSPHATEWRSYNILKSRYIDGLSLRELSGSLSLSERQLRRDHNKALQALTSRVWKIIAAAEPRAENGDASPSQQLFETNLEKLDIGELLNGVTRILQNRISSEGFQIELADSQEIISVHTDRIIARQILIRLISHFLDFPSEENTIRIQVNVETPHAIVQLSSMLADNWSEDDQAEHKDILASVQHWGQQINSVAGASAPSLGQPGEISLSLHLPLAKQPVILVIDDQKPTHQMFRRFLSKSDYQIVGITDSSQALEMAHKLQPRLITLDVMMPSKATPPPGRFLF
jgi:CheY-like chemotaxis protein